MDLTASAQNTQTWSEIEKQMMQKEKKMQERGMGSKRILCSSFIETKGEEKKEIDEEHTRRTGRICNNKERARKRWI